MPTSFNCAARQVICFLETDTVGLCQKSTTLGALKGRFMNASVPLFSSDLLQTEDITAESTIRMQTAG